MNPPQVLIERTAIAALCDVRHTHHAAVAAGFLGLLEEFEGDKLLLVAVSEHLRPHREWYHVLRRGPLAPVDALHVGHQHRRAARRMADRADFDTALTLVMCQRHKLARMLTLDPQFLAYDLDVQLVGDRDGIGV
jgi:hypothetical protein